MSAPTFRPQAAPARASSPCTKVCVLDAGTDLCTGCGRTRAEIGAWGSLTEPQRLAIMSGLAARLRAAHLQAPSPPEP